MTKFYGVVQDITEHKLAEQAERKSEARLRAVFEHIPYDLWVCDEAGRYIMQNFRENQTVIKVSAKTPMEIGGVPLERRQRGQAEHEAALRRQ